MVRIAILLFLITAWAVPASSAVYSCRLPDGTLFLTDDRDRFPSGCEPVGILELPPHPAPPDPAQPGMPPGEPPFDEGAPPPQGPWIDPGVHPQEPPSAPEPQPQDPEPPPQEPDPGPPAEPPPPGSEGFPPELNPQQEFDDRADQIPGVDEPPPVGARLDPWMEEAQALNREYHETQALPPSTTEEEMQAAQRLQEIEERIASFVDQLRRSGLSPGELAAVEQELP